MPPIDISMARSVANTRSFLDVFARAMQPVVYGRSTVSDKITDVKTAFSSWDNCMNAVFCKWPVIAVIIVGGLILISIIWCCARCLCCGRSCCCECCYCLKCCGNCMGCCDPPRGKKHKYLDEPYIPPHQGYRNEPPMTAGAIPPSAAAASAMYKPPVHDTPQFASFDVSKAASHEDALPVMPTWETANSKKVYIEEEEVEMNNLKKPDGTRAVSPLLEMKTPSPGPGPSSPSPLNSPNLMGNGNFSNSPYARSASVNTFGSGGHSAASNGYLIAGAIPPAQGGMNGMNSPMNNMNRGMNGPGMNNMNGMNDINSMGNINRGMNDQYGRGTPVNGYNTQQSGVADYGVAELGGGEPANGYGAPVVGAMGNMPRNNGYNNQQGGDYRGSPGPQQQQGAYGARNVQPGGNDYYNNQNNRNANNSMPMGYDMDNRAPTIPELGDGSTTSPGGYGPNDNRAPNIPELGGGELSVSPVSRYATPQGGPRGPGPMDGPRGPGGSGGPGRYNGPNPYGPGSPGPNSRTPVNNGGRPLMNNRPPPQRQYTGNSSGPGGGSGSSGFNNNNNRNNNNGGNYGNAPVSPPLQNTAGFDFSSGYSRPQTREGETSINPGGFNSGNNGYNNTGGSGYGGNNNNGSYNGRPMMNNNASPPPLAQPQPDRSAYPGYQAYRG